MRVICVQSFERYRAVVTEFGLDLPEVGSDYNVVGEETAKDGTLCYVLAEFPDNMSFDAEAFATLPDATATELYEEEFEGVMQ